MHNVNKPIEISITSDGHQNGDPINTVNSPSNTEVMDAGESKIEIYPPECHWSEPAGKEDHPQPFGIASFPDPRGRSDELNFKQIKSQAPSGSIGYPDNINYHELRAGDMIDEAPFIPDSCMNETDEPVLEFYDDEFLTGNMAAMATSLNMDEPEGVGMPVTVSLGNDGFYYMSASWGNGHNTRCSPPDGSWKEKEPVRGTIYWHHPSCGMCGKSTARPVLVRGGTVSISVKSDSGHCGKSTVVEIIKMALNQSGINKMYDIGVVGNSPDLEGTLEERIEAMNDRKTMVTIKADEI